MSREYIERRLREIGAPASNERPTMRRAERNALIVLRAQRGESYAAIGKDVGLTAMAVSKIARARGVNQRGAGRPKPTPLGFRIVQTQAFTKGSRLEMSRNHPDDENEEP